MIAPSMLPLPNDVRAAAVAVVDAAGNQLSGFDASRPGTATLTTVPSANTSTTILAANPARRQFLVYNASSKTLYLAFGATATTSAYTVPVAGNSLYISPLDGYTGIVTGIWSAVNGNAQVTEVTS